MRGADAKEVRAARQKSVVDRTALDVRSGMQNMRGKRAAGAQTPVAHRSTDHPPAEHLFKTQK